MYYPCIAQSQPKDKRMQTKDNKQLTSNEQLIATLTELAERIESGTTNKSIPPEYLQKGQRNFAVRISDQLHQDFVHACKERGTNMTHVIKLLMSDWIAS